jgi:hypothetical protein
MSRENASFLVFALEKMPSASVTAVISNDENRA